MKQVAASHYDFSMYESPERFTSYFHQINAALHLNPETLLDIGIGSQISINILRSLGVNAYGMDIDHELRPSLCGSVLAIPLSDESVDVAMACQVLEHIPFDCFRDAMKELARVSRKGVVVSLPEFGNAGISIAIPYVRKIRLAFRILPWRPRHEFDGQHHWEINKHGHDRDSIISGMESCGLKCEKTWMNSYNPYHRFFILRK